MTVIINELDVAVQRPAPQQPPTPEAAEATAAPTPLELAEVLRHLERRKMRVRAE